jgi:hypothetical protein
MKTVIALLNAFGLVIGTANAASLVPELPASIQGSWSMEDDEGNRHR